MYLEAKSVKSLQTNLAKSQLEANGCNIMTKICPKMQEKLKVVKLLSRGSKALVKSSEKTDKNSKDVAEAKSTKRLIKRLMSPKWQEKLQVA